MCSLDSFPGSDVPREYVLPVQVLSLHDGGVSDVSKTELICLPRFRLLFFMSVLSTVGCSAGMVV